MFPIVTLIGRRCVGKSTLFNRLTYTFDALVGVSNSLGLTRDRRYGTCVWKGYRSIIIDTGGIHSLEHDKINIFVFDQVKLAILESHLILFVVDAQVGVIPYDIEIIRYLYTFEKPIFVVVNKIDHINLHYKKFEFYIFGCEVVLPISAAHGIGIDILLKEIFMNFNRRKLLNTNVFNGGIKKSEVLLKNSLCLLKRDRRKRIILAVIGAPNVGKSTFINSILGTDRVIVSDSPGTTRDSISVSIVHNDHQYTVMDTAGIRKKNKISSSVERISIRKTLQIIGSVTVILLLISADHGISNHDLSLLNIILSRGKSLVIGINKWDLLSLDMQKRFKKICNERMHFLRFVNIHFISSLYGEGVFDVLESVMRAHDSSFKSINSSCLTRIMNLAISEYHPPMVRGRKRIKLKYAHIGGSVPLRVVIHGNYVTELPDNYKRYLSNYFSRALKISGSSVCIRFKDKSSFGG